MGTRKGNGKGRRQKRKKGRRDKKTTSDLDFFRFYLKLAGYGISGKLFDWITHFLIGRKQRVGVAGSYSTWAKVLSGIPHSSK